MRLGCPHPSAAQCPVLRPRWPSRLPVTSKGGPGRPSLDGWRVMAIPEHLQE